ncbi:ATP-binding cassette domain-containing protein [Qingshengfaniella alkalisoli]|uniref:ATP-binding cassette domain-containing protein n=1 Tax=Qingshengfaniella alkalisoli TaxID=2599296 RepID=A0A5B8IZC7_9RHOB|nr:ATP-binding cassette domain-containing protein [Qingshengfaniella alkalisoli]QDY71482.1 ATP-binding cassette domain-containing protein [Qingshengfaniella alkalisoli]
MAEGLRLEHVSITLPDRRQIRLNDAIRPGEVLSLMGPSGSGKSTILSALIGALPQEIPFRGRIILNSRDITMLPTEARRIGILFQDDLLFPHLSVGGNLAFGLTSNIEGRATRQAEVNRALNDIGLTGFYDRDPATLSGGQRQRVALARVLLSKPQALLLDEPFSRLDTILRQQMRDLVFSRTRNLPVLLVTHDPEDAQAAGGRIVRLG